MKSKISVIALAIASILLMVVYLLIPPATKDSLLGGIGQTKAQIDDILEIYCSDSAEIPREYLIDTIREKWPDYPVDGICGEFERPPPDN